MNDHSQQPIIQKENTLSSIDNILEDRSMILIHVSVKFTSNYTCSSNKKTTFIVYTVDLFTIPLTIRLGFGK